MTILRMTDRGIERFIRFIVSLKTDNPEIFPQELLTESDYAELIGGDASWLDALNLDDRMDAARGLDEVVKSLALVSAERDAGFWIWCSAYLFDRLCKRGKGGGYAPGELPIWIAEPDNWKRYYRHYLASIWRAYVAHRTRERELVVLLNGPVNTPGELWAQIAATQTLITNFSLIEAIYHLYWDKGNNCRKKGSGGGSPRRLTTVLKQFARTYDFFAMTGDQLVEMLPSEFDRFKELNSFEA